MTASSVTGIGPGSVDGKNKGSERMTLGHNHIIGPRVISADTMVMDGATTTVTLPAPLPLDNDQYVVLLTGSESADGYISAKTAVDNQLVSFEVTGTDTNVYQWCIISKGF